VLDATTGLLYVGNGQYYDPSTGRFLTRDVNPESTNPYVPWNPIGAIVGPLGLIALVFGRKKKGCKDGTFLVLLVVLGSVGMTIAACSPAPTPVPSPTIPPSMPTPSPIPSQTPSPAAPPSPTPTPTYSCPQIFPPGQGGIAYITIDDGPGSYTGAVLDVLAKYQVKATFFLVGKNIEQYPGEVQRIKQEGHAIGVHSWSHPNGPAPAPFWNNLSTEQQTKEIYDTQQLLENLTGSKINLFRAPGGAATTANISQFYNYNWSHDTFDYYLPNGDPQVVADNVFKGVFTNSIPIGEDGRIYTQGISIDATGHPQPIVLIHSIHPVDPPALERLILGFQERHYSFGILPRPCDSPGTITPISW